MIRVILPALLLMIGAAMALERSPKGDGPPGRELTKREQFMRTQRGQELDILVDLIMQNDDAAASERAIQDYRRKYNITAPIGTAPSGGEPGLPKIDLR